MKAQYRFDYSKGKPNRFAAKMSGCIVAVVLDPDVASVFKSSDAVNAFLRSVSFRQASAARRLGTSIAYDKKFDVAALFAGQIESDLLP